MPEEPTKEISKKRKRIIFSIKYKVALTMIFLTVMVIVSMAIYFLKDETRILRTNIISFAERQILNLQAVTIPALTFEDEISMIQTADNLKNLESIKYVYFIDSENKPLSVSFKNIKNQNQSEEEIVSEPVDVTKNFNDDVTKIAIENNDAKKVIRQEIPDPDDEEGIIYDFSLPVYHISVKDKKLATIRMGFSDENIRLQIANAQRIILYIAIGFIAAAFILAYILAFITTRPLNKLSEGVTKIGQGDLDYKIKVRSRDEIGNLAEQFNQMTTELKDARDKEIENRIMEEQLEVAKEIQEGLNPMGFYDKEGIQLKGYTRAAKGVGGDYFDYIDIDDFKVSALISDVSGKGIPASLVMVMIRTVFVSIINQAQNIQCAEIVNAINNSLSADFAIDKFATLFFMIYNRKTEKLQFSNAGHGPLFCYRKSKDKCTLTNIEGVPIGIMDEVEYNQTEVDFHPGDIVILYTDGVTEMRNEKKEEYGRTRLQKLVMANIDLNANELVDKIITDVDDFRGTVPPHDDTTTLVLKRTS